MKSLEDLRRELFDLMQDVYFAFLDTNAEVFQIRHKELTIENDIGFATYKTLEDLSFIRNTDILEDLIFACKKSLYVSEIS